MLLGGPVRGGDDLWKSVAARLVLGSLIHLRDGDSAEAMSRLCANKRGEILRDQFDQVRSPVRGHFAAGVSHVQRIVGDALPARAPEREKAEWHTIIDAVVTLGLTCTTLSDLEVEIAEQSRRAVEGLARPPPQNAVVLSTIHSAKGLNAVCRGECWGRHRRTTGLSRREDVGRDADADRFPGHSPRRALPEIRRTPRMCWLGRRAAHARPIRHWRTQLNSSAATAEPAASASSAAA